MSRDKILCCWLTEYQSGTPEKFFRRSLEKIGYELETVSMNSEDSEAQLLRKAESGGFKYLFVLPYKDFICREVFQAIKQMPIISIAWQGDDEWLWTSKEKHSPALIANDFDYNVTTHEKSMVEYYRNGAKALLVQWGFDDDLWVKKEREKTIDVYFCGSANPVRDFYYKHLVSNGVSVKFQGYGYGPECAMGRSSRIEHDEMLRNFQKAKICLNFNIAAHENGVIEQIKQRTFEIPATGSFQFVSDMKGDIRRFFTPKEEIGTFKDEEDLVKQIKFYLSNDTLREQIAKRGHERNKKYSYVNIFTKMFKEVERCEALS